MRATIFIVLVLCMAGLVVADENWEDGFHEVRCDEGWWNTDMCMDYELQDEFDDVAIAISENNDRDDRQDDKIRAGEKKDKSQDRTIQKNAWKSTMGDMMLGYGLYKNGANDEALEAYVKSKEEDWNRDTQGGWSRKNMQNWLNTDFLDYLTGFFVQHAQLEEAQKRIDALEARLGVLERAFTIEATQEQMDCATAMVEAERTGEKAYVGSVQYNPDNAIMGCVIFG